MDYPAFGGSWQRTVRDAGRVGSVFDSAGGKVSDLTARDQPLSTDALERQQQRLRTEGMYDPEDTGAAEDQKPQEDQPLTPKSCRTAWTTFLRGYEKLRLKSLDEINVRRLPDGPPDSFIR